MFALLGFAEVAGIAVATSIVLPLFLRPTLRRIAVLKRGHFDVCMGVCPAVYIEGRQAGLLPWLLSLVGIPLTTLEATDECLSYNAAGIWREQHLPGIPIPGVRAEGRVTQPMWFVSATGLVALVLVIYTGAERMTWTFFASGALAAGLSGLMCALERTNDLVIKTGDGETIVLAFTAIGPNAVTLEEVKHAAERINELAMQARRSAEGAEAAAISHRKIRAPVTNSVDETSRAHGGVVAPRVLARHSWRWVPGSALPD